MTEIETCPKCKASYYGGPHECRDTKCAFCRKELNKDEAAWCISFGNASLLGKKAVDQVCADCIIAGFEELDKWRKGRARDAKRAIGGPHPFECPGCPDCKGVKT